MIGATTYHILAIRSNGDDQYTCVRLPDKKLFEYIDRYQRKGFERVRVLDDSSLKEQAKLLVKMGRISPLEALQSPETVFRMICALLR